MIKRTNIMLTIDSEINKILKMLSAQKGLNKSELIELILTEYSKKNYMA